MGTGADAGKTGSDPSEPVVTLAFSGGRHCSGPCTRSTSNDTFTNWGHEQLAGQWFHLAVVNDGRHSTLYVDSSPLLRNPATPSNGLATAGKPWLVGANHYDNVIEQAFAGHIGELRIVDPRAQAVPVPERLNGQPYRRTVGSDLVRRSTHSIPIDAHRRTRRRGTTRSSVRRSSESEVFADQGFLRGSIASSSAVSVTLRPRSARASAGRAWGRWSWRGRRRGLRAGAADSSVTRLGSRRRRVRAAWRRSSACRA